MSTTGFGEKIHPTDRIREVLNAYSFSSAILRELLANSDDAQGNEQRIALDRRNHPHTKIHDSRIADTQGPAVLAFNNSVFREEDWDAIQFIGHSSKTKSTSKIGKFGLGIRSCYHITDYLQILSGEHLLIFDPLRTFTQDGGIRLKFNPGNIEDIRDHFTAFSHFLPAGWNGGRFDGTIIRLPLRNKPGLREKTLSPKDIEDLFESFIQKDLRICLLFVNHIRSITLDCIDEQGNTNQTASCTIAVDNQSGNDKKVVRLQVYEVDSQEEWLMVRERYPLQTVLETLASQVGTSSLDKVLQESKLCPDVSIAFPLHLAAQPVNKGNIGQLFTFLPLPVKTGFPAHVHALFALDSSRQHLCMNRDSGTMRGSENQIYDEWNRVLFKAVIPEAWAQLLSRVAAQGSSSLSIFSAWPDPQLFSTDGESAFWRTFTQDVLDIVLNQGRAVWPASGGGYHALNDDTLFVFSHDVNTAVAKAFDGVGLKVCGPVPQYLFDSVAVIPKWSHRVLTPSNAAAVLKDKFCSRLRQVRPEDLKVIFEYLLSSGEINNIVDLPIVPTVSGEFISLVTSGAATVYTLLEPQEYDLFHACDPNAITLNDIPPTTGKWFKEIAPRQLNVKGLDPARIIQYLSLHPSRRNIDLSSARLNSTSADYLTQFWVWLGTQGGKHAAALLPQLKATKLLPCVGDGLEDADPETPVFDPTPIEANTELFASLRTLGVPFLLSPNAQLKEILRGYGLLKSPCEVKALLRCLGLSNMVSTTTLAPDQGQLLLDHLNTHMRHRPSDYDRPEVQALQRLPIFPIVEVKEVDGQLRVHHRRSPVEGCTVYGAEKGSFAMLPNLPNVIFVDATAIGHVVLAVLNRQEPTPLTAMRILSITVERQALAQQPRRLLSAILSRAAERQRELAGTLRDKLRSQTFILSEAGSTVAPGRLIDPLNSPLHPLYKDDPQRLPRMDDEVDGQIVTSLSSICLLDRDISKENVEDRIRYVAVNHRFDLAVTLLNILYSSGFDCWKLDLDPTLAWLPTQNDTLTRSTECRPGSGQGTAHDEYLFDKVLERISPRVRPVPPTLIAKMGWNHRIPVGTLRRQLVHALQVVGSDVDPRIEAVLKELSQRQRSEVEAEMTELKRELAGKQWVPVTGVGGDRLVEEWEAVFSSAFPGVHQVKRSLLNGVGKRFLRGLGCLDKPSSETVRRRLMQLSGQEPSPEVTSAALDALQFAVTLGLSDQERAQLLVPDERDRLRPIQEIIYNDVGSRSLIAKLDVGQYIANRKVVDELARSLRLERLGLKFVLPQALGEDMGVSPATIVKKTLAQYTEKQFLLEFLANAEDAGASTFEVILNDAIQPRGSFLSSALERICSGPSIMVCNDSEFEENDFNGIRRTHIGGKVDDPDSIGQFGLGALTMFHVTECVFIFSGTNVLILDPSKMHLPIPERASLMLPLKDVMDLYSGHTECLKGLSYFDQDARRVNGTVFFLPLRNTGHTTWTTSLGKQGYTIGSLQNPTGILRDFQRKAQECLLFIKLDHIRVRTRIQGRGCTDIWSVDAERLELQQEGFVISRTTIQSRSSPSSPTEAAVWVTASRALAPEDIPLDIRVNGSTKLVRLGVAASLEKGHRFQSKFFTMLPLAIPVALPVHINASFRMSADRRQIRFDSYGNDDTRYNRWLLTEKIPQVYLVLLETLAREGDNSRWWPGASLGAPSGFPSRDDDDEDELILDHEDRLTSELIDRFYEVHLPQSNRDLFVSMYTAKILKFSQVVLFPSRSLRTLPDSVAKLFDTLKPEVLAKPSSVRKWAQQSSKAKVAGPEFFKQLLMEDGKAKLIRDTFKHNELCELLEYLAAPDPSHLEGLPLLLLEDGTWATFKTNGPTLYLWETAGDYAKTGFLPGDRFVYFQSFPSSLLGVSSHTLCVAVLTAPTLKSLLQDRIVALRSNPLSMGRWVTLFWEAYPSFPQRELIESVESLSLVPTVDSTSFKTLLQVKAGEALLASVFETSFLMSCFRDLGIAVIDSRELPSNLSQLLRFHSPYSPSEPLFISLLRYIKSSLHSAIAVLRSWPFDRQEKFAKWVRRAITMYLSGDPQGLEDTARSLPVWPARRGVTVSLCPAHDVTVLPPGVSLEIGRFCRTFVTDPTSIDSLDKQPISVAQLFHQLQLPAILGEGDDETVYRDFFQSHLLYTKLMGNALVPNNSRLMVPPATLFEHSEFLDAAFGPSATQFLLPSFNIFARRLPLRRDADVDFTMFAQCARAFQDDGIPENDKLDRARIVYEKYHTFLPTAQRIENPKFFQGEWRKLDHIRFIPKDIATSRMTDMTHEIELPPSIQALPRIVSPREVVRDVYLPVAWTQRARLALQPGVALQIAYPDFGTPSKEEVIAHLGELIQIMPHGRNILPDLTKTYEWLDAERNVAEVGRILADMRGQPIFLNVDDPTTDEWTWCAANQLALESHDVGTLRAVRRYLQPFHRLLRAADVLEADYPEADTAGQPTRENQERVFFQGVQRVFQEQRLAGRLTDVEFIPDEDTPDGADGPSTLNAMEQGPLRGHRSFLAGCSPIFKAMFTGEFEEGKEATPSSPQTVHLPHSAFAIKAALDYFYTSEILDTEQDVELDDLLNTLGLAHYLDAGGLLSHVQREIITRKLVDPYSLDSVREYASTLGADALTRWCDTYRERNTLYITAMAPSDNT